MTNSVDDRKLRARSLTRRMNPESTPSSRDAFLEEFLRAAQYRASASGLAGIHVLGSFRHKDSFTIEFKAGEKVPDIHLVRRAFSMARVD